MHFDKIIMNPPYSGSLHLKILSEVVKENPGAEIVCLHPGMWIAPSNYSSPTSKKWRAELNGHCKSIEIVDHNVMNSMFGTGNSIETGLISVWGENIIDLETYGIDATHRSLYDKVCCKNTDKVISLAACRDGRSKYGMQAFKDKPVSRKECDLPIYTWHGGATLREALIINDETKKVGMVLYFKDENEHANFVKSLDTKFMTWYWKTFVVENGDNKLINYFFRLPDYSHPWTDADLYAYFNLTEDEIKTIEKEIKE